MKRRGKERKKIEANRKQGVRSISTRVKGGKWRRNGRDNKLSKGYGGK